MARKTNIKGWYDWEETKKMKDTELAFALNYMGIDNSGKYFGNATQAYIAAHGIEITPENKYKVKKECHQKAWKMRRSRGFQAFRKRFYQEMDLEERMAELAGQNKDMAVATKNLELQLKMSKRLVDSVELQGLDKLTAALQKYAKK